MSLVLNVEILGEFKKLTDATNGATKQLSGLQKTSQNISKKITGAFAAIGVGLSFNAIVNGIKDVTKAASDLGEAQNAVNVAFGDSAKELEEFSKTAAQNLGLSRKEILGISTQFSSFAKTIGGEGAGAIKVIKDLSTRGADFASVFNLDVSDALEKFQSGLAGQSEPLRKFGIDLSAASVEAYALANGIFDGTGQMTEQEKVMARYGLLMEQTAMTAGDFKNTSDSLANTQRILKAEFENVQAEVGTALLPAMVALFQEIRDNLPEIKTFIGQLTELVPIFIDLVLKAIEYKEIILALVVSFGALTTAIKISTVAAGLLNGALLGPGIVGAALVLAGIAAGMATVYENTRRTNGALEETNRLLAIQNALKGGGLPLPTAEQINAGVYAGIIPGMGGKGGQQTGGTGSGESGRGKARLGGDTVNININRATVNADDITDAINKNLRNQGSTLRIR